MPNYIKSIVSFKGDQERINELYKFVSSKYDDGDECFFDFNKIIPQPDNIFLGDLGQKEKIMCIEKGIPNWYDWNYKNWGTKWRACEISKHENIITFETAWATPRPVFEKLSQLFPDIEIEVRYTDEFLSDHMGILNYLGGRHSYTDKSGDEDFYNEIQNFNNT